MKSPLGSLELDFQNGTGSANYDQYPIDNNGACVPVTAKHRCMVCFHPKGIFRDRQHDDGETTTWCPKAGTKDVTVYYVVLDHDARCPHETIERTYSIKIGSGSLEAKKA
jgi:hypothetical protein